MENNGYYWIQTNDEEEVWVRCPSMEIFLAAVRNKPSGREYWQCRLPCHGNIITVVKAKNLEEAKEKLLQTCKKKTKQEIEFYKEIYKELEAVLED